MRMFLNHQNIKIIDIIRTWLEPSISPLFDDDKHKVIVAHAPCNCFKFAYHNESQNATQLPTFSSSQTTPNTSSPYSILIQIIIEN